MLYSRCSRLWNSTRGGGVSVGCAAGKVGGRLYYGGGARRDVGSRGKEQKQRGKKEFLIVVEPSVEDAGSARFVGEVRSLRKVYEEEYGVKKGGRCPVCVPVCNSFSRDDSSLRVVKRRLEALVKRRGYLSKPFKVPVDGFIVSSYSDMIKSKELGLRNLQREKSRLEEESNGAVVSGEILRGIKNAKKKLVRLNQLVEEFGEIYSIDVNIPLKTQLQMSLPKSKRHPLFQLRCCIESIVYRNGDSKQVLHDPSIKLAYKDLSKAVCDKLWYGENCEENAAGEVDVNYFLTGLKDRPFKREMVVDRISIMEHDQANNVWKRVYQTERFGGKESELIRGAKKKKGFMIALEPSKDDAPSVRFVEEVTGMRNLFSEKYGLTKGLKRPVCVPLTNHFHGDKSLLEATKKRLEEMVKTEEYLREPFTVPLDGFRAGSLNEMMRSKKRKLQILQMLNSVSEPGKENPDSKKLESLYTDFYIKRINKRMAKCDLYSIFVNTQLDLKEQMNLPAHQRHCLYQLATNVSKRLLSNQCKAKVVDIPTIKLAYGDLTQPVCDKLWYGKECETKQTNAEGEEEGLKYFLTGLKDKRFERKMLVDRISIMEYDEANDVWNSVYHTEKFGSKRTESNDTTNQSIMSVEKAHSMIASHLKYEPMVKFANK
eukprot:Nk52_evm9s2391 gene=Nk52_evmTU9s2391